MSERFLVQPERIYMGKKDVGRYSAGMKEGIKALVEICKELGVSKEEAESQLF